MSADVDLALSIIERPAKAVEIGGLRRRQRHHDRGSL
jgi:hypothetical protein